MRYNDMSPGDRQKLLKGGFGNELLDVMARSVAAIYWGDRNGNVANNGSVCFLNTGERLLAVTARHVYDSFKDQKASDPTLSCQINNIRLNPSERLIAMGSDRDIATFGILKTELAHLDKLTVPWPPLIPQPGQAALFAGVPGAGRTTPRRYHVDFGIYLAMGTVESVSDRDISLVKPNDSQLLDVLGTGLPEPGFDLGGMSGGPIATIQENHSIVSWSISGIIYQHHQSFEILKAVRADCIAVDGSIIE